MSGYSSRSAARCPELVIQFKTHKNSILINFLIDMFCEFKDDNKFALYGTSKIKEPSQSGL